MTYKNFIKECMNLSTDGTQFGFWIDNCQFKLKDEEATGVVEQIDSADLTMTMAGIKKCLAYITEKEKQVKSSANDINFKKFKQNLELIDSELQKALKKTMANTNADPSTLFESYSRKFEDFTKQLDDLRNTVGNQTNNTDSKLFSTIINMIAILGIFVAISFAGFGSVSLASKIEINMAEEMLKSTFYILILGLLIYNFLLLLIYFILKIVYANLPSNNNKNYTILHPLRFDFSYRPVINKFLIIIDIMLFLIALSSFICALIF